MSDDNITVICLLADCYVKAGAVAEIVEEEEYSD